MTDTASRSRTTDVTAEVNAWLEENWDPELTVGEWWERLGLSGWAAPTLPENAYGRGLSREEGVRGQNAIWAFGALGAPGGLGMLLARTDGDVPKHQGISYFALDMHQPAVEVRPLREMTGRAMFNEVFFSDARVSTDAMIGGLNNGWAVANTTLAFERAGLGAGGGSAAGGMATPGTSAVRLHKRGGGFVAGRGRP